MPLKTPSFWYRNPNTTPPMIETLLQPLSLLYGLGRRLDFRTEATKKVPVICVGNLVAGGSGKTPTLIALFNLVKSSGLAQNPAFVSRGYGGSGTGPHRITSGHDTVQRVGDEPLLLAKHAQTFIARKRTAAITAAHEAGADLVLMDDGFQNKTVRKDLSFVVIDGASGFGNEKLLPAGPLREPIAEGLTRVDAVIIIGTDQRNVRHHIPASLPIFQAHIRSDFHGDKNQKYIAFCGIARPEKFQETLRKENLAITHFQSFPDHHVFSIPEIEALIEKAHDQDGLLITTEKDHVRLPVAYQNKIITLPISVIFDQPDELSAFLQKRLRSAS